MFISRRSIIKTSLWSMPVVSAAHSAPAFASSTPPALECKPKGNRSQRHDGNEAHLWDYHLKTGCNVPLTRVVIHRLDAKWDTTRKVWTVKDTEGWPRTAAVLLFGEDGSEWAGMVKFS